MAAARTPGMWSVFRDHPTCRDVAYIRAIGSDALPGHEVAVVFGGDDRETDAQLLADAPALLKALRDLLAAVNVRIDDPRIALFDTARALVAKVDPDGPLSPAWCASIDNELAATAEADAKPAKQLLNECEQKAVLRDLMGLECLINYHECEEVGADAMEPGMGAGNARRALELLAIGRGIIAEDPDLWFEEQKAAFKLRHREAVLTLPAAAVAEGAQLDGESLEQAS